MDGFTVFVSAAQALSYAVSVSKRLHELRRVLKYGGSFVRNEEDNVCQLQEIIVRLIPKDETRFDASLDLLLQSISATIDGLLALFKQQTRLHLAVLLIIRRVEVNESFASLERKKNTLILYLTTQNYLAAQTHSTILSLGTEKLSRPTESVEMASPSDFHLSVWQASAPTCYPIHTLILTRTRATHPENLRRLRPKNPVIAVRTLSRLA